MAKTGFYTSELRLWIDDETKRRLKSLSSERGEPISVIVRRFIAEALASEAAVSSLDIIRRATREVIRNEIKPLENRLAKLNAKSGMASATAMFMLVQTLEDLGKHDCVEIYEKGRKKAYAYLKDRNDPEV